MIKNIGKHRIRHGDIHDESGVSKLVGKSVADIFYSDPPWGSGNLRYWDTMNKKQNGITDTTGNFDVDVFLHTVLQNAAELTDGWVVIEYGKQWIDKVIKIAEEEGLTYCTKVEALYANNLPLEIIFFRTDGYEELDVSSIHHLKGYGCVKAIFKLLKPASGGVGMDLCCGMGYTAQACIDNGLAFIGNELNLSRLKKTIARLEKGEAKKLKLGKK